MMTFRFIPQYPDECDIPVDERFMLKNDVMCSQDWGILVVKITESLYVSRSWKVTRQGQFLRVIDDKIDSYKI